MNKKTREEDTMETLWDLYWLKSELYTNPL